MNVPHKFNRYGLIDKFQLVEIENIIAEEENFADNHFYSDDMPMSCVNLANEINNSEIFKQISELRNA